MNTDINDYVTKQQNLYKKTPDTGYCLKKQG